MALVSIGCKAGSLLERDAPLSLSLSFNEASGENWCYINNGLNTLVLALSSYLFFAKLN
jgi:hypothetical protein